MNCLILLHSIHVSRTVVYHRLSYFLFECITVCVSCNKTSKLFVEYLSLWLIVIVFFSKFFLYIIAFFAMTDCVGLFLVWTWVCPSVISQVLFFSIALSCLRCVVLSLVALFLSTG